MDPEILKVKISFFINLVDQKKHIYAFDLVDALSIQNDIYMNLIKAKLTQKKVKISANTLVIILVTMLVLMEAARLQTASSHPWAIMITRMGVESMLTITTSRYQVTSVITTSSRGRSISL